MSERQTKAGNQITLSLSLTISLFLTLTLFQSLIESLLTCWTTFVFISMLKSRCLQAKIAMVFSPLFLVNQGTIAVGSKKRRLLRLHGAGVIWWCPIDVIWHQTSVIWHQINVIWYVTDERHMTQDECHMTQDECHMTPDESNMTPD